MIAVEELSREFFDKKRGAVRAVDRVSFRVGAGRSLGCWGRMARGRVRRCA